MIAFFSRIMKGTCTHINMVLLTYHVYNIPYIKNMIIYTHLLSEVVGFQNMFYVEPV